MAGLLAGAMKGLGQGMAIVGKSGIEEKRAARLEEMRNRYQTKRDEAQYSRTVERDSAQQDFTLQRDEQQYGRTMERDEVNHNRSFEMERYRQGQQNSRTAAARADGNNDWQMVPAEDGRYIQFSPSRNEYRDANLPEGVSMSGGGELTDRQKYQLDGLSDQIESLRSRASEEMRPMTPEEKAQLGRLQGQYDSMLGGGDSMTTLERLMAGEGGSEPSAPQQQADQPAPDSIPGQVRQQQEQQRNTQEANDARREASQARDSADAVLQRIEREAAGGASRGGLLAGINKAAGRGEVSQEAIAEAQQIAQQILTLDQNPNISADEKRWLSERLIRLQEAGVPLNLD